MLGAETARAAGGEGITMAEYEAYRYAADRHAGEQVPARSWMTDGEVIERGTLDECRQAIQALLPSILIDEPCPVCRGSNSRHDVRYDSERGRWLTYRGGWYPCCYCAGTGYLLGWAGTEGDVEAYHESLGEGCGGWAIRRVEDEDE
jgi:hypothetical protein